MSVSYFNAQGESYTDDEVEAIRKAVKNHLVNYGAITTMTGGNHSKFYNGSSVFGSTAYNCNDTSKTRDHAVTIVGWDDNYSRNNFADGTKPSRDGAYIVLNSYGEELFNNGQVFTQYVDELGNPTMSSPFNPNGSMMAIEGIVSNIEFKLVSSDYLNFDLYKIN